MGTQAPDQIQQIQKQLSERLASLRADKDLSPEGRRRKMKEVRTEAEDAKRKAKKAIVEKRDRRERTIYEKLFGNPTAHNTTSLIAYRDAMDRAAEVKTPTEAASLLSRARMVGDHQLAQAVAMRSLDGAIGDPRKTNEWSNVLDQWATAEPPSTDELLTELGQIHRERTGPARIVESMKQTLENPSELQGRSLPVEAEGTTG